MKIFASLSLLLLLISQIAGAVIVPSLYNGTVAIQPQTSREQAISAALEQVLIKVSGNPQVATIPEIQAALHNAEALVDSYSYNKEQQTLTARFAPVTIKKLLRDSKQAIWGANRPQIMLWLAVTPLGGTSSLINNGDSPELSALQEAATNRGLPLMLPILDLTDLNALTPQNLASVDTTAIQKASSRYHAKIILAGNLVQQDTNIWQTSWYLLFNGSTINWQTTNEPLQTAISTIIDRVAVELATNYATLSDNALSNTYSITVSGAHDLNTDLALIKYLNALNTVSKVSLDSVSPTTITIKITSSLSQETLEQKIQQQMLIISPPSPTPIPSAS